MIKRTITTIAAALLAVTTIGIGTAQAAISNDSCNTGGTTAHTWIDYTLRTVSDDGTPLYFIDIARWQWDTIPDAQLNRAALQVRWGGQPGHLVMAAGGSAATLNDVPESKLNSVGYTAGDYVGPREWRVDFWGGVGNSTDTCTTGWRSF